MAHLALPFYTSQSVGVVVSVVRRMNEVALRWDRLLLGWVTGLGQVGYTYRLGM